ncbi:MAG: hypothetical protein A2X49_09735 [Lentisphaerae bacterium GWF2_52_8]|nr:MAG: hypothetical protein A2X49_09735 [Lentisphaerae bacterium GWF2_52_8]
MSENLKIVIVEDDAGLNELIRRRLVREGHECICFHRAGEVVSWLAGNNADLMIIDLVLPDCSGDELISILAKNNINIPFIIATGQGSEAVAVKMLKRGARDYLVKNSDFLELLPSAVEMVWREIQLERLLEHAREKIRVQNAMLGAVSEFSPDGILVVDGLGRIIFANELLKSMWEAQEKDFPDGQSFFKHISERVDGGTAFLSACLALPHDARGLILSDIKASGDRNLELYSAPLEQEGNSCSGRIWYFRDVTTHKKAQEAMAKAKFEAEQNARMRSKFFALISHDVKTPLNSIAGFINLLETTGLSPMQKEYTDIIKSSGEHLLVLINDILDLTKIEHGAMDFHIRPLSARELFRDCVNSFLPTAKESGVELICEIDDAVPEEINGDLLRLRQIVINLLGNAMKFTQKGHVKLKCSLDNGEHLLVKISDTGIGIDKKLQDHLFKPFYQADSSVAQKYGGSGLGLAISKQLVEALGGSLFVESEAGRGSTFSFTIPIDAQKALSSLL